MEIKNLIVYKAEIIQSERINWQFLNQERVYKHMLTKHLKQLNFDYIKQKENDKKRYRKTLTYGIIFMILFTICIIFLWNCTPNQDKVFAYNYDLSSPITDTECENYYLTKHRRCGK